MSAPRTAILPPPASDPVVWVPSLMEDRLLTALRLCGPRTANTLATWTGYASKSVLHRLHDLRRAGRVQILRREKSKLNAFIWAVTLV